MSVCVCVSSGKGEQAAVAATSNRFLQFVSGEKENTETHQVFIALLPFSRYFVTFAPPWWSHKENSRVEDRRKKETRKEKRKEQKESSRDGRLALSVSS